MMGASLEQICESLPSLIKRFRVIQYKWSYIIPHPCNLSKQKILRKKLLSQILLSRNRVRRKWVQPTFCLIPKWERKKSNSDSIRWDSIELKSIANFQEIHNVSIQVITRQASKLNRSLNHLDYRWLKFKIISSNSRPYDASLDHIYLRNCIIPQRFSWLFFLYITHCTLLDWSLLPFLPISPTSSFNFWIKRN